jgi:hypothetical protein
MENRMIDESPLNKMIRGESYAARGLISGFFWKRSAQSIFCASCILLLLGICSSNGCASNGADFDSEKIGEIHSGVTTESQLIA